VSARLASVYGLRAGPCSPVFYIGVTERDPHLRGKEHYWCREYYGWNEMLRKELDRGEPDVIVLEVVPVAEMFRAEARWIRTGRALGLPLVNVRPRDGVAA